ncbi:MAG TPA: TonB-dependent receptor [Vicinamibacterales bacterium]|nr:TonB-dependent receptor [Vicinamibacterales bacterium]
MRTRLHFLVSALPFCFVFTTAASAQTAPAQSPPTIHESVVVTATGRETPESAVGASISVLNRDEIEQRHALSTIDLLRTIPGVVAVRAGGVGNLTGVFVRGGESTYNKVLLDGMPLNEPGGSFNFASLSPENIERIEVLRGAHSALFGSDAMASVIQLFSVRPESGRPQFTLTLDGGTYDTTHVAGGVGARTGSLEYSLFSSWLQTDNREPNNANDTSTVSGSATRSLTSGGSLRVAGRGEFGRTGTPGTTAFGRPDMDAFFRHRDGSVLGGWNQPIGARVTQQTSYSHIITKYRSTNLITDPPYTPTFGTLVAAFPSSDFLYDSETELARQHFQYRADAVVGRNQVLTAAFAYDGERGVLTDHRSTAPPQRLERNNTGTTVQYEASAQRVSLVGGIRFENNGSFGFYAAPRVAVSWLLNAGNGERGATRLRGSIGGGIKEPLFIQSYSPSPFFLGNPDLKPERSRGFDLGIEQRFARDRAAVELTYFANHFDDLISLGPFDPVTFHSRYENIGETRATGFELTGTAIASGGFRVTGGYTYLDSKVIRSISSSPIFAPGRQLYRRPRHSGSMHASYARGRVSLALGGVFISSRVDSDFNFPTISSNEGYASWNASGDVRLARRTAAFVTIDNLSDREYMEPLGYRALGRTVRVGVRARF